MFRIWDVALVCVLFWIHHSEIFWAGREGVFVGNLLCVESNE